MKKVLIPLAPGFEEIEAVSVIDILRRAGARVMTAGIVEGAVEGRNGIKVTPDRTLEEVLGEKFDMLVLPGGGAGTENLRKDARIRALVEGFYRRKKFVAAICAAPTILSAAGVTEGRKITAHPSVREALSGESLTDERVVVDGNIITSQGPGTAMEFAFRLVEVLFGKKKAREVNSGVLAKL